MLKLILIAVSSIGQIDRPLLAEGVGKIGGFEFDPYPTIHLRDIITHEAHRHPYIEILGTIYLMKLRHSNLFVKRAGSTWRLFFVYALFPWLHHYRIFGSSDGNISKEKSMDDDLGNGSVGRTDGRAGSGLSVSLRASTRSMGSTQRERELEMKNAHLENVIKMLRSEAAAVKE